MRCRLRGQVPIFDDIISPRLVWPVEARWPLRRAQGLLERFRACFPDIYFDMYWATRLMNAQAYIGEKGRSVRLYGGLGRHREVGVEGIAFALAHEVGHHLGGEPRHEFYTMISSEERASEWAEETGMPIVFGEEMAARYVRRGVAELAAVWKRYRETYEGVLAGAGGNDGNAV
jgi:hypothetical protein